MPLLAKPERGSSMAYRLTKIYTRAGDKGETRLGDNSRVSKDNPRVEAYGTVDELNSLIGLLLTYPLNKVMNEALEEVQHDLFDLGGELSNAGLPLLDEKRVTALEKLLDELNAQLPPLKEYVLPGGTRAAAICHLARTVCRRAERRVVTLGSTHELREVSLQYLNRLSDLLFVMARSINRKNGSPEVLWRRDRL
jgi:cob(I)alamin adenosyltransferase